jgi:hypothetical protein
MHVPVGHIHREDDLLAGQADRLAGDAASISLTNHCFFRNLHSAIFAKLARHKMSITSTQNVTKTLKSTVSKRVSF